MLMMMGPCASGCTADRSRRVARTAYGEKDLVVAVTVGGSATKCWGQHERNYLDKSRSCSCVLNATSLCRWGEALCVTLHRQAHRVQKPESQLTD